MRVLRLIAHGVLLAGCSSARPAPAPPPQPTSAAPATSSQSTSSEPFPSTYRALPSRPTLITNATVLTAAGPVIERGSVLMRDGKIAAVGANITAPTDAVVIDATGKFITPGIIDNHSHMGVYASPGIAANNDGNELTDPVTAQVWAEHSIWPHDPQFALALAGGITSAQILPGSGNLIGGRGVTIKNVPSRSVQGMKFPGAPHGLKMACGENPKRVYGGRSRSPATAMGNVAGYRAAWIRATKYRDQMNKWRSEGADPTKRPDRDLQLETLAGVLNGEILVQNHCYRGDEMLQMIDIAKEFGYKIAAFHHAVESYKIRDVLAREGICSSMWADWWGFKLEAYDGIKENIPLVHEAGACAIVHSDDAQGIQRLNQEAAKAMTAGRDGGINLTREDVIKWITINPARSIGIDKLTGSLENGKMADVVIWNADPFSVYAKAEKVFIDGALVYDRNDPRVQPRSDFMLGILPAEIVR
jgi:imidazolonepropionase-like amidohydrolase